MTKRLSNWLMKITKPGVALLALVIFLYFMFWVLPAQSEKARVISGGAGTPDTSFFYTPRSLYNMAEVYGEQGRLAYVKTRFTFDLVFPLVYTFFLCTATTWVYRHAFKPDSLWQYANLIPLPGMLFDYLENIAASWIMLRYPAHTVAIDLFAPAFTVLKWVFISASFVLLLAGLAFALWRWGKNKAGEKA